MKTIVLSSTLIALLTFTGCSTKEATIDATGQEAASTTESTSEMTTETVPAEDVVVVDEGGFGSADSNEMTMSGLERQMQTVNFDFDKFVIRADMKPRVEANTNLAKVEAKDYMIKLEGNCDEWGSDEYNYALGLRRANAIKSAMTADGVAPERITMVSYGESNPVCTEKTQECWANNRRVDFKLLP
jgi:peptidoglycan-associated lipoprotein